MKAIWNGKVIAESDDTVVVEGNHYFPAGSLSMGNFSPNSRRTTCGWKGEAHYYDVTVDGQTNTTHHRRTHQPLKRLNPRARQAIR